MAAQGNGLLAARCELLPQQRLRLCWELNKRMARLSAARSRQRTPLSAVRTAYARTSGGLRQGRLAKPCCRARFHARGKISKLLPAAVRLPRAAGGHVQRAA